MPEKKPKPLNVGDYFAYDCLGDHHVRLRTGPRTWNDSERAVGCVTREGAERLAVLMNHARDLARDHHLISNFAGYKGGDSRDWVSSVIAHCVCNAVDTPAPLRSPVAHTRDMLLTSGDGELTQCFEYLDAAGTPATLDNFAAGVLVRKEKVAIGHDRCREIVRAWRRTFDPSIPAAARAAKVMDEVEYRHG